MAGRWRSFNSLFEMRQRDAAALLCAEDSLSILYLRCSTLDKPPNPGQKGSTFNSLFEMRGRRFRPAPPWPPRQTFNSLFEMRHQHVPAPAPLGAAFNSLFEMRRLVWNRDGLLVNAETLSILYLRCTALMPLALASWLVSLSILYLRCWGFLC